MKVLYLQYLERVGYLLNEIKEKIIAGIKNDNIMRDKHIEDIDKGVLFQNQSEYLYKNIIGAKTKNIDHKENISGKNLYFNNLKIKIYQSEKDKKTMYFY